MASSLPAREVGKPEWRVLTLLTAEVTLAQMVGGTIRTEAVGVLQGAFRSLGEVVAVDVAADVVMDLVDTTNQHSHRKWIRKAAWTKHPRYFDAVLTNMTHDFR